MKNLYQVLFIILISNSFFATGSENQLLDNNEIKISAEIDANLEQYLASLKTVVNINSGTKNFAGVKAVGLHFKQQLDDLNLVTEWLEGAEFDRAGHLVSSTQIKDPNLPNILLIGHLDTVFSQSDSFQEFKIIDQQHIAGPGITDMKGGDVIMIAALTTLKKLDLLKKVNIKVVLTGDEESSGDPLEKSKEAIISAAKWADIALGFEDGDGDIKTAVTARRGGSGWQLTVTGKAAHSSQIFREDIGYGAIFEAARILNAFRQELSNEEYLTFNPGLMVGGTRINLQSENSTADTFGKGNVIAQTVIVKGDLRTISLEQLEKVKLKMQSIVNQNLAHTQAKISFSNGYPPMAPTEGNNQLLQYYSQVSQDLGYGEIVAVNPSKAGAADISFAANHVKMSLDGLGLMGVGGHTKDEVADMDSFAKNIKKAAILIYRLSKQP